MDYKKIFNQAYELYTANTNDIVNPDDIIVIDSIPYKVMNRFGKFHRVFNLVESYEQLICLNEVAFTITMSQKLKQEIISYEKPELNIRRYYNKGYLGRKS